MAVSAKSGKCLKKFPMNCDAKRFSFEEPFTALSISLYSSTCCNTIYYISYTVFAARFAMAAYLGYFIARLGQNFVAFVQSLYVVHLLNR